MNPKIKHLARIALVAAAALSTAPPSSALTSYNPGDVFIGFRQTGETDTLVVNLGPVTKFLPASLGGTWNGDAFNVTFGLIPNTATVVTNLNADLTANFGLDWADNFSDGSGVRWAVAGITNNAADNTPIIGFGKRTAFVTVSRSNPNTPAANPGSVSTDGFGSAFSAFANGAGEGAYVNQESTVNSTVAFIGDGSDLNNWNTKISLNNFSLGAGKVIEQKSSGAFQGTTNSVLDFWVIPTAGSGITTTRTFTGGSFTLSPNGVLTYGPVPEPGSGVLLGVGAMLLGAARRRRAQTRGDYQTAN